ncbi:MAG: flagellar biosynthesis protein FliQ [Opitutales bacterium]
MNVELAVDLVRQTLGQALLLVAPIMATAIAVGVFVSLLQSVTSIQEQTLTFVPKLVCVSVVIVLSANWMLHSLMDFATGLIGRMPELSL